MTASVNECIADLKRPWQSRHRKDGYVTGAIELAFLRGYQAGLEDARSRKRGGKRIAGRK